MRTRMIATGGVVAALAAGGVALANTPGQGTQSTSSSPRAGAHPFRGVRPLSRLTHGELNLWVKGRDVQVRIDRGVLESISSSEIVLHELDGSNVTVPVDSSTIVRRMGQPATLSDLRKGDVAFAARPDGKPARLVRSPGHPPRQG